MRRLWLLSSFLYALSASTSAAFVLSSVAVPTPTHQPHHTTSILYLQKGWLAPNEEDADDDDDEGLVTREMLQRDLLQDPQVKRKRNKNGKSGYKPLDNRDHLPFAVKKITPDPYTRPQVKNSKRKTTTASERKKKTDLDHQLTSSRLYQNSNDENASTLLGEFQLDKSTTSGDVIYIGQREYQVQRARCQYKYAGGQRFVMVRKILEVKEVNRVAKEELLMRQYQQSDSSNPDNPPELE
jgi:hypothetical protein